MHPTGRAAGLLDRRNAAIALHLVGAVVALAPRPEGHDHHSKLLLFRRFVTLGPRHSLFHYLGLPTLVGFSHKLRDAVCMLKRTVRREKQIVPEPVP